MVPRLKCGGAVCYEAVTSSADSISTMHSESLQSRWRCGFLHPTRPVSQGFETVMLGEAGMNAAARDSSG